METKPIFIVKILYKSGTFVSIPFLSFSASSTEISWKSISYEDFLKINNKYQNFCHSPLRFNIDEIAGIFQEDTVYLPV